MTEMSLNAYEREVEDARVKLTQDLAVLCSPRTVASFTDGIKQQALETKDALWEKLKARAAANPAAMMAIAAGLGWHFIKRPPIASGLIGLGLFSLWRTSPQPLDRDSSFIQESVRSLKVQGEEFASAASDVAAKASEAVAAKGAEVWDTAKANVQTWTEAAGQRLDEARAGAKSAADATLDNLRRQRHDLRDEVAEFASSTKASLRDEDTRNTFLLGLAGVAVAAAVGIACQKRITETIDG